MRCLRGSVWGNKRDGLEGFVELACALVARIKSLLRWGLVLFCVPKENQKSTSDFDALDPRERGCSPLSDPEGDVETEKS